MPIRRIIGYARMGRRVTRVGTRCARVALWVVVGLALGCASTPDGPDSWDGSAGHTHILRPGENLYRLSIFYGVSVDAIRRANDIDDVTRLNVGQRIWIPRPKRGPAEDALAGAGAGTRGHRAEDLRLIWPVRGKLSSRFGWRNGRGHDGIDIPARSGTPIVAAAAGRVIHSGRGLGDYGRVIIVKHEGYYSTVYAHNRRNRVDKGDFVEKGEVIGEVGSSGNASGSHVHFEVRHNRRPLDPLFFLP